MAAPTVGVVLCVAGAHLETFGSLDGVAKAKGELIDSLDETGVAILNSDDPLVAAMADRTEAEVLTFGSRGEVRAEELEVGADLRARFTLRTPHGSAAVRLAVPGVHQVSNALAAAASGVWLGVGLDGVAAGLEDVEMSPWRMELQRSDRGIVVLNDAYNANPTSTAAALRSFAQLDADRKVAVLGPMAELGPDGPQQHRQIAQLARELGLEVLAVGASDYAVSAAFGGDEAVSHVDTIDEALAQLGWLRDGDAVLVKGSRVAALEKLAARLLEA
jgi:UDP-N-acetylmuramoyl-tripeptide--D-alanyl-D-alanine ligase